MTAKTKTWKTTEQCTGDSVTVECVETGETAVASVRWAQNRPLLYGQPYHCVEKTDDNPHGREVIPGPYRYV